MISIGTRNLAPEHQQLNKLWELLEKDYPLPTYRIRIWYDYSKKSFNVMGMDATGRVKVSGKTATVVIAAKDRSARAVALTTAHEYMHCIQFIKDDLYMTDETKQQLEAEAINFAEEILERLWKEQKVFFPSS